MVTRVKIFRNENAIQNRRCAQRDTQEEGECRCPETFLANVVMYGNRHGQNEKKTADFVSGSNQNPATPVIFGRQQRGLEQEIVKRKRGLETWTEIRLKYCSVQVLKRAAHIVDINTCTTL